MKLSTMVKPQITNTAAFGVISISVLYWVLSSYLQLLSSPSDSLIQHFWPSFDEAIERLIVVCLFVSFGSHIQFSNRKRREAEAALDDTKESYRLHFQNASDLIFLFDADYRVLNISDSVETMLGYKTKELKNQKLSNLELISPGCLSEVMHDLKHALAGQSTERSLYEFVAKSGDRKAFEVNTSPRYDYHTLAGAISVARDVTDRKLAEEELEQTVEALRKSVAGTVDTLISVVETRDPYTAGHQKRVADLSRRIADKMGLPSSRIDGLRLAGSIHDLGKISVPAEILSKPSQINEQERALIQNHPKTGHDILQRIEFPWPIAQMVYQHHEKMDGSGYPQGLSGDEIILEARIICVADAVEAIGSHRPYRASVGMQAAIDEVSNNKGVLYDPAVVDACLKALQEGGFAFQ